MLSYANNTQKDLEKLSSQYAHLLGHQNQKQKIQHIINLKEQVLQAKQVRAMEYGR